VRKGTEQGKDREDQGNFLGVFRAEMHPESFFSMFSFGFPGQAFTNPLWFPLPLSGGRIWGAGMERGRGAHGRAQPAAGDGQRTSKWPKLSHG